MSEASSVYRGRTGQWAFMLHRITGFLVIMFLLLHVVDVSLVAIDKGLYNEVHELYGNVFLRLFEVGLLFALVFHALNGLRIIIFDFFPKAVIRQKELFWGVVFLTGLLTVVGGYVILEPFLLGAEQ